ncbi:MAG TPA: DMT family transporter [Acidimicrobiia bacterium]|jgi:drug/metabolite transporter (DMT)-like permease
MTRVLRDLIWQQDDAPAHNRRLTRAAVYTLLVIVVLILGLNWPIMSAGVSQIGPVWMGVFRVAGAMVVLMIIAAAGGRLRFPPRHDWPIVISLAVFRLSVVSLLVFTALEIVPPGRSSVVAWTTPLWTVPIAAVFLGDRMTPRRWVGLVLGVTGVVVLFEPWALDWSRGDVVLGHLLLVLAAITNASTAVHIRGHKWSITPLDALPWQLAGSTIILLAVALTMEGVPRIDWSLPLAGIVAYQGMLASGIALWAQIVVLRNIDPVSANLTMMGTPAVGVISSAIFVGEVISFELAAGLVLIVAGVAVNLLGERRAAPWTEGQP